MGMQLTRFDRWLREKFVHEIHVYSLRPPEHLPRGVREDPMPEKPGARFKHRYVARTPKAADALIAAFKEHNQMFATRVVDRHAWYVPLVAPEHKSVSWWVIGLALAVVSGFYLKLGLQALWTNPEFRQNFAEALQILQG